MARPQKWGLDYFPFDVDFFEDAKLSIIRNEFGSKGEIVLCGIPRRLLHGVERADTCQALRISERFVRTVV